jgi:glycerol dehydrogenase-like iron-containing ADH family enzyme
MQDFKTRKSSEQEDLEFPMFPQSVSLMNHKICPFSPSKVSELTISEEETSYTLKANQLVFHQRAPEKFILDISSIQSSPQKLLNQHMADLKSKLFNLADKFANHQNDVKEFENENIKLKNTIIKLQESLLVVTELSLQERSKCKTCVIC